MDEYSKFLNNKLKYGTTVGFKPTLICDKLFDFQKYIVSVSLEHGRFAIFADCGMGKTAMQLEWSNQIIKKENGKILISAPLCVSKQTKKEGEKFDIEVNICRSQDDVKDGINITNYEMLHHFNPDEFCGVVLDECFAPNTLIDVFSIDKGKHQKYIKDIRKQDKILNVWGVDDVQNIYKRRINRAVKVCYGGEEIICSENHPFFTMYGWKFAQDIQSGDCLMETKAAMRLVRNDFQAVECRTENAEILQSILFSEMENDATRNIKESSHAGSTSKDWEEKICMVQEWKSKGIEGNRKNAETESHERSKIEGEDVIDIAEDWAQTFRAWGKWKRDDIASAINEGCTYRELDNGICYITGKTATKFSNMLQSRLRESRNKNSNRSRRSLTQKQKKARQEKGQKTGFIRVDSIEILELGDSRLDKFREKDGFVYFYDIKAKQHPSFSVNDVIVHNSGIIKNHTSKYRNMIIDMFSKTKYKLSCTATPSPNDYVELGNQAEFLGIMSRAEMLSMFFINDTANVGTWRLKGHAEDKFFEWLCSWSIMIKKPSNLDFKDGKFILPKLNQKEIIVDINDKPIDGMLFPMEAKTLSERRDARRTSLEERVNKAAEIVNNSDEQFIVWCDLNIESDALKKVINNSVEVKGSDTPEHKEKAIIDFQSGRIKVIISKPSIYGFGINLQNCHNMVFVGLSDSFEAYYQAVRRCWRFGQEEEVNAIIITSKLEGAVLNNIKRKEKDEKNMTEKMIKFMKPYSKKQVYEVFNSENNGVKKQGSNWEIHNGDSVELVKSIKSDSIHYSLFSPPFASLFTYSDSHKDMGNCKSQDEFMKHFSFLAKEIYRIIIPGRLMSFHVMNLPATITQDGFIGIKDLRGDLIRLFQECGFIFHSEVCIWKDPLVQATRTKTLTLAHKQISKDSSRCGQGFPDYIVTMRKKGDNPEPVCKGRGFENYIGSEEDPKHQKNNDPRKNKYSHLVWQRYASPVWFDIRQTRTLNERQAREDRDEKHMCPLQLDTIERCIDLWTNQGDIVFSPFAGIGSEGYGAILQNRRFLGFELKQSYFNEAVKNLIEAEKKSNEKLLF